MYSCDELFLRSREDYFGVYCPRCFATRKINANITLEWNTRWNSSSLEYKHYSPCIFISVAYRLPYLYSNHISNLAIFYQLLHTLHLWHVPEYVTHRQDDAMTSAGLHDFQTVSHADLKCRQYLFNDVCFVEKMIIHCEPPTACHHCGQTLSKHLHSGIPTRSRILLSDIMQFVNFNWPPDLDNIMGLE